MNHRQKVPSPEKNFMEMSRREKFTFVGKACVFFISGGFVFPTLWID